MSGICANAACAAHFIVTLPENVGHYALGALATVTRSYHVRPLQVARDADGNSLDSVATRVAKVVATWTLVTPLLLVAIGIVDNLVISPLQNGLGYLRSFHPTTTESKAKRWAQRVNEKLRETKTEITEIKTARDQARLDLDTALNEVKQSIQNLRSDLNTIDEKLPTQTKALSLRVSENRTDINSIHGHIKSLNTQVAAVLRAVEKIEKSIATEARRIDLEADAVAELQAVVNAPDLPEEEAPVEASSVVEAAPVEAPVEASSSEAAPVEASADATDGSATETSPVASDSSQRKKHTSRLERRRAAKERKEKKVAQEQKTPVAAEVRAVKVEDKKSA